MSSDVVRDYIAGNTFQGCRCSQNGIAQTVAPENLVHQCVVRQIIRCVSGHFNFLADDPALPIHLGFIEERMLQHVHQNIGSLTIIFCDGFHIVAGRLLAGKCVHLSADAVNITGNLPRGSLFCALEHHVFYKVRYARVFICFIHRTGVDPDADGNRLHRGHVFHDHPDSVIQCSRLYHSHSPCQIDCSAAEESAG